VKYGLTTIYSQFEQPEVSPCPCLHGRPCPLHVSPNAPAWRAAALAERVSAELLAGVSPEDDGPVE
jgi:hypothetical protein